MSISINGQLPRLLLLFTLKVKSKDGGVEDAGSQEETFHFATRWLSAQLSKERSSDLGSEEFAFPFCHSPTVSELM